MHKYRHALPALGFLFALIALAPAASHAQGVKPPSDVKVINTPNVLVGNPADNPALVRNFDEHSKQPLQKNFNVNVEFGELIAEDAFTVPAGKRLVIQHVSFQTGLLDAGNAVRAAIAVTMAGEITIHPLDLRDQQFSPTAPHFVASHALLAYADAGTVVRVHVRLRAPQNPGGAGSFSALRGAITGYLVDAQ